MYVNRRHINYSYFQANICHNNICVDSIYVTENGSWKLGGFDCACPFTETSPDFLKQIFKLRNEESVAPEEYVRTFL